MDGTRTQDGTAERRPERSGLVICGGKSRRMGTDKALVDLAGARFLDRSIAALAPLAAEVVLATGVSPRVPDLGGIDHEKVLIYTDVLRNNAPVGKSVAVIGAGGIGFDVSEFLVQDTSPTLDAEAWFAEWGVDLTASSPGGLIPKHPEPPARTVYLLQRKDEKLGKRLGKTSGWVHRTSLMDKQVQMIGNVTYDRVDDAGLHIFIGDEPQVLEVDHVVICAGQEPLRELLEGLEASGKPVHLIGGADVAAELDAKRAIRQASELAAAV